VLVHGLTFDRRIWQPIIDRLGDSVTSLAIDLPAHGESKGEPVPMQTSLIRSTAWCKHPAWNVRSSSVTPPPPRPPVCTPPHTRRAAS
jgi:pimeloyl-ACP methyl ester carboxylesterase